MERRSTISLEELLKKIETLPCFKETIKYQKIFREFLKSYLSVIKKSGKDPSPYLSLFDSFLSISSEQFARPYQFELYHKQLRAPFDYYRFGIEFMRPLVDLKRSTRTGMENFKRCAALLEKGENVVLLANHQIEADPQAISILMEEESPTFATDLIFVAGTRVTSDPLAIPFSMGCNLLCIHSKKYIDHPPQERHQKQMHNKRTMERMVSLLKEGGKAIYVAPSGGRDRSNAAGQVEVAPLDPQSVEMFYLMAQRGGRATHFFPLSLSTHHLLPPSPTIEQELGETRITHGGAIHLHFGEEIDMEHFPGSHLAADKRERRALRARYIWEQINAAYQQFPKT